MSDDQPLTNGRNLVYFSRLVRVIPPTAVLPEYVFGLSGALNLWE